MRRALALIFILAVLIPFPVLAGLDISAYSNLLEVANPVLDEDGFPKDTEHEVLLRPVDFPERFKGLKTGAVYRFSKSFEFRAGSYSGYNWWRNELAKLAGYPLVTATETISGKPEKRYDASAWKAKGGPFWELIEFSDAEGVIGPVISKKLYADFLRFHKDALLHPEPSFVESYKEWEQAFKLAAENGAVEFH
jgi:hypothetical protein